MLCLTLKEEQKVAVGDLIIVVRRARNGEANLGFDGPRDVPVVRENAKTKQPKERIYVA